jgi:acyl-CoA synthetase (AMP-forming)/AMP-acid ligase II
MSKVGGALPSWYWPAGIPRRVPVAQQPLGRLLRQRFATAKDRLAIVHQDVQISYGQLLEQCVALAGGIQSANLNGTIAIAEADPVESLKLCLAGWIAGRCVFLADPGASGDQLEAQLAQAKASALIGPAAVGATRFVARNELKGDFAEAGTARRATDPAVLIAGGKGLVVHSHFSLTAMAASMAAFIPRLREIPFVCTEPALGAWETLTGIVLALFHGMPIKFNEFSPRESDVDGEVEKYGYLIIQRNRVESMLADKRVPAAVSKANYVFVSTGFFAARWRQRVELILHRPVFPVWGLPEIGPLVAAHPTWLPPHGHGFPLVNVSLIPIDPGSGKVSIVPWEMLEQAEVGVEALSAMVGYVEPSHNVGIKAGTAVRTRQVASMDHVGVVVLRESSPAGPETVSVN